MGEIPLAIINAAPMVGISVLTPGQTVAPEKNSTEYPIARSPIQPPAARRTAGIRTTFAADNARSAPGPSSQMRVVDTKKAVSGLLCDWMTAQRNDKAVTVASRMNAPRRHLRAARTATSSINNGQRI